MVKKLSKIIPFVLIFLPFSLPALNPGKALTQYILDSWNDEKGLPQNSVRAVLQTGDGYLWFGTEEGLVRFDGVKFSQFDETNTPQIKNNYITALFEDKEKNLWIGTRGGGLIKYGAGKFKHYGEKEGLGSSFINAIAGDEAGNLWVGTDRGGLFKFKDNTFTAYTTEQGLLNDIICCIYPGRAGVLWIGTIQGLSRFKDNKFTNFPGREMLPGIHINTIYEDSRENLWLGTEKGLFKWEQGKFVRFKILPGAAECKVNAIYEDRRQNLWIGTASHGLFRCSRGAKLSPGINKKGTAAAVGRTDRNDCSEMKGASFYESLQGIGKAEGLSGNFILSITEDHEGSLWIGTAFGGVSRLRDGQFTIFSEKEGLSNDIVFSAYEDSNGYLWVGTNHGLNRFKDGEFLRFTTKDGLSNNVIATITEDSRGFIWVCTDDGLNKLQNSPTKITKIKDYLRGKYLLAVFEDRAGNLWAGTLGGLFKKNSPGEKFTRKGGLPSKVINFIYEDRGGSLWISTFRKGLVRYSKQAFTIFNRRSGLINDSVNCIYEDAESVLWIGTINGVTRFRDGKLTNYTRRDGLFNDNIYQILEDGAGSLWMSCNKGIFRVSKKELNAFARREIDRVISVSYGKNSGMRSRECNGGFQGAGCKTRAGELWFPTMKGVVCIDPGSLESSKIPPPVFLEQILLDGLTAAPGSRVTIEPGVKRIEFLYTAPSFINPEKVKFKYRMEGYEKDWVDAGTRRIASYTNLDPRKYTFRVTACNSDGVWSEAGADVPLEVIPPFWKTWWFICTALLGFAIFSYAFIGISRKYFLLARFWKKKKYAGGFKLLEQIGSGGMGTVYKARRITGKGGAAAVKVLREDLFTDARHRKRFKQEAAIIDQLDHPNIVEVFERGESKQNVFIAMEMLDGVTLAQKIEESAEQKMDLKEALDIMGQVMDALKKVHSKNIVHRDMKPENIMLIKRNGSVNFVKLLDFGLAQTDYQSRLTRTGAIIGTINYMSPEQIGRSQFSSASDIYSSGIIFYEMLTGSDPFRGENTLDIMKQVINETPLEPVMLQPGIPAALNDLVMVMISKDRRERPAAEEILEKLRDLQRTHFQQEEHEAAGERF
ncbi:MAG: protein kinase [Candidatus Aminicenantes bacterium]|nr:protein kinase [Candidatus Aminicenantes bacterium]